MKSIFARQDISCPYRKRQLLPETTIVTTRTEISCQMMLSLSRVHLSVAAQVKRENHVLNARACLLLGGHGLRSGKRVTKRRLTAATRPKRRSTHAERKQKRVALHRNSRVQRHCHTTRKSYRRITYS